MSWVWFHTRRMPRQKESIAELLLKLPWWVSAGLGLMAYAFIHWAIPAWAGDDPFRLRFTNGMVRLAPFVLIIFGMLALASLVFSRTRRKLVDRQTSLETLSDMTWKQFEWLVAEAFRREGYRVDFSVDAGPDGGIDLVLHRDGRTSLVQCKQWRTYSVGVPVIREMFGLMVAEDADEVIIVTSGQFTNDAKAFAEGKPIWLIDGPELLALVQSVQDGPPTTINQEPSTALSPPPAQTPAPNTCPQHRSATVNMSMVLFPMLAGCGAMYTLIKLVDAA